MSELSDLQAAADDVSQKLTTLADAVTAETAEVQAAIALLEAAASTGIDPAALVAITDQLKASASRLSDATTAVQAIQP